MPKQASDKASTPMIDATRLATVRSRTLCSKRAAGSQVCGSTRPSAARAAVRIELGTRSGLPWSARAADIAVVAARRPACTSSAARVAVTLTSGASAAMPTMVRAGA